MNRRESSAHKFIEPIDSFEQRKWENLINNIELGLRRQSVEKPWRRNWENVLKGYAQKGCKSKTEPIKPEVVPARFGYQQI